MKRIARRTIPAPLWARLKAARKARRAAARARLDAERLARCHTRLLRANPALRSFTAEGRTLVGVPVDSFTAAEAAEEHLRTVVGVAEAAGIEYFLVRGRTHLRHVVGLRHADKDAFLAAMRERFGDAELYVGKPEPGLGDGFTAGPVPVGVEALPKKVAASRTLRFGRYLLGPAGQLLAGPELGCDVEFWQTGEELLADPKFERRQERMRVRIPPAMFAGALVAPRANDVADVLPEDARIPADRIVGERKYATFAPFNRRLVNDVDFPIDAVYMWVDGEDPEWMALRDRHLGVNGDSPAHMSGPSCYISRDELKYSLRSLHAFAPFIRNVYIVTAGQTPAWLDTDAPGIRVVDHAEIFADPSVLPVFNSQAIEAQLHRIPGLSDHYLVLNDDTFFGRPVAPQQFFHSNGIAQLPFSPAQIGLGEPHIDEAAPSSAGKNVRRLLEADFDRFIASKFKHVPHPQLRKLAVELEERYADEVAATTASRFRDPGNINFATALHHHYALFTGKGVPGRYRLQYIDVTADTAAERLAELSEQREADTFCLNDVNTTPERANAIDAMVRGFLEDFFPFPSPYEKRG
ncbi:MAG TPA: stealth family protein [Glycomyces sp.]|nr:stealth family protein [Glycomyces sp.]